jgi:lipopolysaccharide transport system ATP-binding protein
MADPVILVEGLSKRYRIGRKEKDYETLRETIIESFLAPVKNFRRLVRLTKFDDDGQKGGSSDDVIWALKNVSFEVHEGEALGIVGRNGAGKSTLLKILSRIVVPTEGRVLINDRVTSLLNVGMGFHQELTGRENVYLNGAILGMKRWEINQKFDEIVAFSEIEKFIDTPVKRYSKGMYIRLAFSVAAHLEPEILMIDEVLAVGDLIFREKCLNKMIEETRLGKTVVIVSHNMGYIKKLCPRSILLQEGNIIMDNDTESCVEAYLGGKKLEDNAD